MARLGRCLFPGQDHRSNGSFRLVRGFVVSEVLWTVRDSEQIESIPVPPEPHRLQLVYGSGATLSELRGA